MTGVLQRSKSMSTLKDLKNYVKYSIELEMDLVEFCQKAIKEIFGEDAHSAKCMFEEYYDSYDVHLYLPCPADIRRKLLEEKKESAEWLEKNKKREREENQGK